MPASRPQSGKMPRHVCLWAHHRKRIRGSHILPVVPVIRGSLPEYGGTLILLAPLPETRCLLRFSQERTSGPSGQREKLKKVSAMEKVLFPQDASALLSSSNLLYGAQKENTTLISTFVLQLNSPQCVLLLHPQRKPGRCVWESTLGLCSRSFPYCL